MKFYFTILLLLGLHINIQAQFKIVDNAPRWELNQKDLLKTPEEGVWSIATSWKNDWPADWVHVKPSTIEKSDNWTIISGKAIINGGEMLVRDSYRALPNGLTQCIRRYEWHGKDTLNEVTLSVRLHMDGNKLMPFVPGVLYYGNPNGASVNPNIIPVYKGEEGDIAIFEDHRYPQPYVMLEDGSKKVAAAVHTTPSSVRGAVLSDQWWSMGVEASKHYSEFVLLSGPIAYNKQHSVAKARQFQPMRYTDTYIKMEPGRIIEKEFFVDVYSIEKQGTGFQRPLYTSIAMHKPFNTDRFPEIKDIVRSKYNFASSRWIDGETPGFGMYDLTKVRDIVVGWAGQSDAPGFALQVLAKYCSDPTITDKVQRSMDFLSKAPIGKNGIFPAGYNIDEKKYHGGDPVSCGQAMYNFALAIKQARKDKRYNTKAWEEFLQNTCDAVSDNILSNTWNPRSTADAFYIAPLALSSKLFRKTRYLKAAQKAGALFAERHLHNASYWGGTLDATCEDKEGAWAAFQGFLALYEQTHTKTYLEWAKHAMDVCLSYTVIWDIPLPAGRMADYNFKTTGWTVVSPQNQHIDVYGVVFTPEIYRMGQILKNDNLKKLAEVMYRSCFQLTDAYGAQGEQLQQTNFAQQGDMSNVHRLRGGYSERWTVFWITAHFLNAAAKFELLGLNIN
ncbi:MAG: hypothetical protein ACRDDZ_08035 [Marinifilaceae bacterium]